MIFNMISLIVVVVILILIYYKAFKPLSYWDERGVPHKKPLPIIGNSGAFIFKIKPVVDYVKDIYNEFPNERYYGIHQYGTPALHIKDLDLIKKITVKDFDQFMDHNSVIPDDAEPLMGKSLNNLKGQTWREVRAIISPSFTSSKMKYMFTLLSECAQDFIKYFETQDHSIMEIEMKDIFTRFTNDAIASVAFGIKCDSLTEKTNEFYIMAKIITSISTLRFFLIAAIYSVPFLNKIINMKLMPSKASSFFRKVVAENIYKREKEKIVRPDMINLLLKARNNETFNYEESNIAGTGFATVQEFQVNQKEKPPKLHLTDEDITAHALIFIFGGFEICAALMSFIAYELAINLNVQEKLQKEIDDTLSECNGELTYASLNKMKYLDMVVSETLRKWPFGFQLNRQCVKDYVVEPEKPHEKTLVIEKGTMIIIPVVAIHHDPQHFQNPLQFDPERFNEDNKLAIKPYSYLPFGSGPRNCIASRFAVMESKILIFHLFAKFNVVVTNKTSIPLKLAKGKFNVSPENGFWLGLEQRNTKVQI